VSSCFLSTESSDFAHPLGNLPFVFFLLFFLEQVLVGDGNLPPESSLAAAGSACEITCLIIFSCSSALSIRSVRLAGLMSNALYNAMVGLPFL